VPTQVWSTDLVYSSWYDNNTKYLYFCSSGSGLSVFDTKGTDTQADDELVRVFNTSSTPALLSDFCDTVYLHPDTNQLYVGDTGFGMNVIDVGPDGPDFVASPTPNDVLVRTFTTSSTPAITGGLVWDFWYDYASDYVYVNTSLGLSVLDVGADGADPIGDPTPNDILVRNYTTATTPALPYQSVKHSWLDTDTNYLYVATEWNGVVIFDVGPDGPDPIGSPTPNDVIVRNFNVGTTPALLYNLTGRTWLDKDNNHLYIDNSLEGVFVIDLGVDGPDPIGSPTPNDAIIKIYSGTTYPELGGVYDFWYDEANDHLYISHDLALTVINVGANGPGGDDVVLKEYTPSTNPAISAYTVNSAYIDDNSGLLYAATWNGGLSVVSPDNNTSASYYSNVFDISSLPSRVLKWDADLPTDTSITVRTRTGDANAYWHDEFDDGLTANISDYYFWGSMYNTVSESNGILLLEDSSDPTGGIFWIDTGKPADFYPAGTVVRVKMKVNVDGNRIWNELFYDNYDDTGAVNFKPDEWVILESKSKVAFSQIGFWLWIIDGFWEPTDSVEVDWVQVEMPTGWSTWSDVYTNPYGSVINSSPADQFIQYRVDMSTNDVNNTPEIDLLSFASGYQNTGVYESAILDTGEQSNWLTFNANITTPTNTSVEVRTRSGNKSDLTDATSWSSINPLVFSSPADLSAYAGVDDGDQYFQYQIVLNTTDPTQTPSVSGVSLEYSPRYVGGSGSGTAGTYPAPSEPESGEFEVVINNNDPTTETADVVLTLDGGPDAEMMSVSNTADFSGAGQEPYSTTKQWELCETDCADGTYTVYVKYFNETGQATEVITDEINYQAAVQEPVIEPEEIPTEEIASEDESAVESPVEEEPIIEPTPEPEPVITPEQRPRPEAAPAVEEVATEDEQTAILSESIEIEVSPAESSGESEQVSEVGEEQPTDAEPELKITEEKVTYSNQLYDWVNTNVVAQATYNNQSIEKANDAAKVPLLVGLVAVTAASTITLSGLLAYIYFLLTQPFLLISRKKRKPWGVVYDSITKKPLDLAIVRLYDKKSNRLISTQVTDSKGRYNFIVDPGKYYLHVSKPDYKFPSKIMRGKANDQKYTD